jgi:hypothetical protein
MQEGTALIGPIAAVNDRSWLAASSLYGAVPPFALTVQEVHGSAHVAQPTQI